MNHESTGCLQTFIRTCISLEFVLCRWTCTRIKMLLQIGQSPRCANWKLLSILRRLKGQLVLWTSPEFVISPPLPRGKFVNAVRPSVPLKQSECRRQGASGVLNSRTRARLITEELYPTWAGRRSKTNRWAINLKLMNLCPSSRDFEIAGNFAYDLPFTATPIIKETSFRTETKCGELKAKSLRTLYSANFEASLPSGGQAEKEETEGDVRFN